MKTTRKITAALAVFIWLAAMAPLAFAAIPTQLVPVGQTVGIDLKCAGVMVVGLGEVSTPNGSIAPGILAGLLPGDVITQVGSTKINSAQELKDTVFAQNGQAVSIQVDRGGKRMQFQLTPAKDSQGDFELGLWLRDGMAGIGTITFYDPISGIFGALGHGVSDVETGVLMPLGEGYIVPASVASVRRGAPGAPGELQGEFEFSRHLGSLKKNSNAGIFGRISEPSALNPADLYPVASAAEITLGPAKILANVYGRETESFDIEISRVFSGGEDRNMMIKVTDPRLIERTGGIVQGMSGSPIIQNDKIIGAVTHVLINNPEKGYGISIEAMLAQAYSGQAQAA